MIFVGIDPDLHCTAVGIWANGKPQTAHMIRTKRVPGRIEQEAVVDMAYQVSVFQWHLFRAVGAFAVEAQTLKRAGLKQHKNPQDIVTLGNVAGAILGVVHLAFDAPCPPIYFPTPETWKGQIPKAVMQARFYEEMGWGYEMIGKSKTAPGTYARPLNPPPVFNNILPGDWKHAADALMLARWASFQSLTK
jgi:hypothetical protein